MAMRLHEMKLKDIIRMAAIGAGTFVLAWFVFGMAISTAVLLISTHALDLSDARVLPAMVPVLSICLAVASAVAAVVKCRKKSGTRGQHPAAPYSESAARSPQG